MVCCKNQNCTWRNKSGFCTANSVFIEENGMCSPWKAGGEIQEYYGLSKIVEEEPTAALEEKEEEKENNEE